MEVEALTGEKEVGQRGARRQDCTQRGAPVVTDAEGGTLRSGCVAGICQRGACVDALYAAVKPRKPVANQIQTFL